MRKVLITGSTGLVGIHLAEQFSEGTEWCLTSRSPMGETKHPFFLFDWKETKGIKPFLDTVGADIIVHTAGVTAIGHARENPLETELVNVKAVAEIADWCRQNHARLVHFSTDFVFDGQLGMYSEDDAPQPLSAYGRSKLQSEEVVRNSRCNAAVIRTVLVYGYARQLSRPNFPLWLKGQLEAGNRLSITADQFRTPTYAGDLADAAFKLALSDAQGLYHVCGPEYLSVYDFALKVCDHFGLNHALLTPVNTVQTSNGDARPLKTGFVIEKVKTVIPFKPLSVADGLKEMSQRMNS